MVQPNIQQLIRNLLKAAHEAMLKGHSPRVTATYIPKLAMYHVQFESTENLELNENEFAYFKATSEWLRVPVTEK